MKAHLVVGAPNFGKSHYVKQKLLLIPNNKSISVYDVQHEYYGESRKTGERFEKLYNPKYKHPDFKVYCEYITRLENAVIVLEECTIFLDPRGANFELRQFLVDRYHTGNYIFLMFHALRFIPFWVYNLCDYVTLFKTNDSEKHIESKFNDLRLVETFRKVQTNKNKHFHKTIDIHAGI